ncbi:MAG: hypothetical protein JRE64_00190 [Deltaproteobacteria bacterium]|nr:hypothetical protein [Deltaproteobacteria bacterium]
MKFYLIEAYSTSLKFKGNYTVIALTPLAAYELDKAGIKYSILEDYYDEAEFLKEEEAYFYDQLAWFDKFDNFLFEIFPEAKDKDLRLATIDYFHLKSMVDSLILRCKKIEILLRALRIDKLIFISMDWAEDSLSDSQPLLFRRGQSLFSRVAPLFCKKYSIQFERILEKGSSKLSPSDYLGKLSMPTLKARLKSYALIEDLWTTFKIFHVRQLLHGRSETDTRKIYFLKTNRYVRSIMREALSRGHGVYYKRGDEIVAQGFVRSKVVGTVPKDDNRLSHRSNYSLQLGSESEITKWISGYCGIDVSQIVLPRLKWYIDSFCVRLIMLNDFYVQFYDSEGIDLVLTPNITGVDECAAITASMLSCKTMSGCLQHGDEGLAMKMHDLCEIAPYDYYFTTHDEREAYAKKRVGLCGLGTKVFQYPNRVTTLPRKNFSYKVQRMFKQHRIVVYVPTMYKWDNTFWNESMMSDTWYFDWHKALLDFMSKREDFNFIWKGIPASNEVEDPIPKVLKDSKVKNVKYAVEPFMKWIHRADMVLLDYPSTALYEAAMSGVPVFSLFYEPSNVVRKSFLDIFGKSVQSFSSFDEGVEKIRTFCDSDPEEFTVRLSRSDKSIFEVLKEEFDAPKN